MNPYPPTPHELKLAEEMNGHWTITDAARGALTAGGES